MFKVFEISKENRNIIDEVLNDDVLGRQSVQYKDGAEFGYDSSYILLIEGSPDIFERVNSILNGKSEEIGGKKAEKIYEKIKEDENNSKEGMGFIFG
ncbi:MULTISPECIES: hypothetical protein [Acidiplasma]|jgi:hypothetical protein|uniref:Uncharacterized protein n=2 Tax=Acidiplasma TaxID=507753 RepID=A0A0Q0WHG0_9ARCH|nr:MULTISPECIES: hypothetical protein [Acidiplasma]KJE49244.1 hypothetical protein TZ01_04035 [Acidiplasma sp. MBA-1]KPV46525.1 hypothetical protein SE19_05060 [Acidiplasma aeolicum]KQB34587.1 hypothetical protein AOG54_00915 [Acidiplasma aeolicum]KQB34946.1 hypothetical protein AOG55_08435 [Acidiplasma cupricumulans]WMT54788.1 MAG: hypothetical protein RE470_07710 [Acidiplasma sp.]